MPRRIQRGSGEQYDYSPVAKPMGASPWRQGSLFTAKPTAEHRWPRGYTPERQAEVAEAIPQERVTRPLSTRNVSIEGSPFVSPKKLGANRALGAGQAIAQPKADAQARRAIIDMVSRSTVPVDDLGATKFEVLNLRSGTAGSFSSPNIHAWDQAGTVKLDPSNWGQKDSVWDEEAKTYRSVVRATPKQAQEKTLLHEIGHSVDHAADISRFHSVQSQKRWAGSWPELEGFAEGYAYKHQVPERGEKLDYETLASYQPMHKRVAFRERFQAASGVPLEESGRIPAPEVEQAPPVRGGHQLPMFLRHPDWREESKEPGYKDLGQHSLSDMTKSVPRTLDTIKLGRGVRGR